MNIAPSSAANDYGQLLQQISERHKQGQATAYQAINASMLETYWNIGQYIVEYEQQGHDRAEYGQQLLKRLSKDLTTRLGKGYSHSQLVYIRLFYLRYPISVTLSHQLSWSHYYELLKIDDELEREFYQKQAIREHWNVRELRRQKESSLFLRLALSKDKQGILKPAQEGQRVVHPQDIIRDTYVLEFLNLPVTKHVTERTLEKRLIENLQTFLL